jgi:lipopolysaccharide biosynthesis regulator YciM
MVDLFWLLLPVAACSGWLAASKSNPAKKPLYKINNSNNFKFNQKYIRGLNFILNDETDKAVDVFLDLFSVDNDTVETHLALGSLFRRRGEVERALRVHQNIIARPNLCAVQRLNGMLEIGYDYLHAGVLDRAENIFKDIVKQYPNNSEALRHLLDIYQRQSDWHSAIDVALLLQKNTHKRYVQNIAHYYCELSTQKNISGNQDETYFYIKQALRFQDTNVRANLLLANFYLKNNQVKKGLKIYYTMAESNNNYLDIILPLLINASIQYNSENSNYLAKFITAKVEKTPQILILSEIINFLYETCGHDYTWHVVSKATEQAPKLSLIAGVLALIGERGFTNNNNYIILTSSINKLLTTTKQYSCYNCGFNYRELLWLCPSCKLWDTIQHIDFTE